MRTLRMLAMAAAVGITGLVVPGGEAAAGDRHWRGHPGRGWGPPPRAYYYAPPRPRVYYAPPPVYYAPPPRVYYAPPPPVYYAPPVYYGPPGVSLNFRF